MNEIRLRVRSITQLTRSIRSYELVAETRGGALKPFTAGAHLTVTLPSGLRRAYSLHNPPSEAGRYRIAVQREAAGRGGSIEMHERVQPGDTLAVSAPRNLFALAPEGPALLIAGGIGITPLLAMAAQLRDEGRAARLVYLVRQSEDAAFLDEIEALAARGLAVELHADGGDPARAYPLADLLATVPDDTHVYCCGPAGLMTAVAMAGAHLPTERMHFESFTNEEAAPRAGDAGFVVRLARSGRTVAVAAGESILDALLGQGLDIDYSCNEGTCGTCITRVLAGGIDHRDKVLLPQERADHIIICCSRATTAELTLDL
ncbi:PDR/VanB family oxidoreductase [Ancylobacter sp. SL191]|uniref:PDR/VanB family oxidoreductase n=1 Tax=Ancylobacter sp. SL191 TaxID=2995166 RepID=UPI00226F3571|nr:PDR/VanB family oxidoreductase [Ancylobacter sp. SL191]WAC25599.1 PDR/VanB family oxidoreductase [Ancylobacter sp. SL191]